MLIVEFSSHCTILRLNLVLGGWSSPVMVFNNVLSEQSVYVSRATPPVSTKFELAEVCSSIHPQSNF